MTPICISGFLNILSVVIVILSLLIIALITRDSRKKSPQKEELADALAQLDSESAKMELQSNDSFLIFYAVLIFTFVIGILTLITPLANPSSLGEQFVLGIIYCGMLGGMVYCIWEVWIILRENHDIVYDTELFPKYRAYFMGRGVEGRLVKLKMAEKTQADDAAAHRKCSCKISNAIHKIDVLSLVTEAIVLGVVLFFFELLFFIEIGWL